MTTIRKDPDNDHDWQDKGLNSAECSKCLTIVGWDNIDFWEECPPLFNGKTVHCLNSDHDKCKNLDVCKCNCHREIVRYDVDCQGDYYDRMDSINYPQRQHEEEEG